MIFDDIDLYLLKTIWDKEEIGTWQLAKDYFKLNCDCHAIGLKNQLIKDRLTRLSKVGLITITKSKPNGKISKNIYTLNLKNLEVGRHHFPDKYAKAICLKINNKWEVFQI